MAKDSPTFERYENWDAFMRFNSNEYKIVIFPYDDEGHNGYVLLDILNKKVVSWSLSGNSERDNFDKLINKNN